MTLSCQRWRARRDLYRPARETITPRLYEVAEIDSDRTAKAFVLEHHYSGSYPAARFRFGLYRSGALQGVAVFSVPCNVTVLRRPFPGLGDPLDAVELGRFVLLDEVPANGETWFLARCFEHLRGRVRGVVSFSDPVPRTCDDGEQVFPGHIGTIYQAGNARYLGRSTARTLHLLPDGRVFSARSAQKVRKLERGWRHVVAQLESYGAGAFDGPGWLKHWLPRLTRKLRHPGNHRYAWSLDKRLSMPPGQRFPKAVEVNRRGQCLPQLEAA